MSGAAETKEAIPPSTESTCAEQGTPSKGTWSDKKERAEGEGMETNPSPREEKDRTKHTETLKIQVHTHIIKFVQINLHHSKAATAILCQQLTEGKARCSTYSGTLVT
jgi:hypothetical protein